MGRSRLGNPERAHIWLVQALVMSHDAGHERAMAPAAALRHVAALASGPPIDPALRITLNFHPDRGTRSVLQALAEDGSYHSQFVTGTSNGGMTAHPGGDRWRWESRMFGGAYDHAPAGTRPVYGALDFWRRSVGGAPRFGSAPPEAARPGPVPGEWHPGFRLAVAELRRHPDYRGQRYVDLGAAIAVGDQLDASMIGAAARSARHDEQDLKRLWHLLARFGAPAGRARLDGPATGAPASSRCAPPTPAR